MKHNISALLASALVALSLGAPVLAQGPGGGGPGGGGGGGQRRMPFAFGAVSAVDATAGTITITPQFGGNGPQTIKVGQDAQITTQTTVTVADLKVGDQIAVQGVPTGITASQIIAGTPPAGMPGAGGPRGGGGARNGGGGNGGNANGSIVPQSYAMATGTIKALPTAANGPLVISMGTDVTLSLTVPSTAKITKYATLTLAGIKTGDQVMAAGQAADDGTFTATSVGVNLPMGNGGPGGFGRGGRGGGRGRRGGGGGGGFGGPGGGGLGGPPPADGGGAPPPPVQ